MEVKDFSKAQGHWILAKMGKRVLRPGGKELTQKLVDGLNITKQDNIVEFAPGMGYTASLTIAKSPLTYTGIDADNEVVSSLSQKIKGENIQFIFSNANSTPLLENSKDKVYGEAMLTMQADHRKSEIIREAHRILKKGGLYAIHELGLVDIDESLKATIQKDLAYAIKVNARPLTEEEWKRLLEDEGFEVLKVFKNDMSLLEYGRIIDDEGLLRFFKIGWNVIRNGAARKRILEMRDVFKKYQKHMNAIVLIAQKK